MERSKLNLAAQLDELTREVRNFASQREQPPTMVYSPCGWNRPMMTFCPQIEQWPRMQEEVPSMYLYPDYTHQARSDQEWQDTQRDNLDDESYHHAIGPQMCDIEESVDRIGVQYNMWKTNTCLTWKQP